MYQKLGFACFLFGLAACTGTWILEDDPTPPQPKGDEQVEFARSDFDGCWGWYQEDGGRLKLYYILEIQQGAVASMWQADRNARSISNHKELHLDYTPEDGLVRIASTRAQRNARGEQELVSFRFDQGDDISAFHETENPDHLPGVMVIDGKQSDDYPTPARMRKRGELIRMPCP